LPYGVVPRNVTPGKKGYQNFKHLSDQPKKINKYIFLVARHPMLQIKEKSGVTQAFNRDCASKPFFKAVAVEECG
jgi:hypothetical protein